MRIFRAYLRSIFYDRDLIHSDGWSIIPDLAAIESKISAK